MLRSRFRRVRLRFSRERRDGADDEKGWEWDWDWGKGRAVGSVDRGMNGRRTRDDDATSERSVGIVDDIVGGIDAESRGQFGGKRGKGNIYFRFSN